MSNRGGSHRHKLPEKKYPFEQVTGPIHFVLFCIFHLLLQHSDHNIVRVSLSKPRGPSGSFTAPLRSPSTVRLGWAASLEAGHPSSSWPGQGRPPTALPSGQRRESGLTALRGICWCPWSPWRAQGRARRDPHSGWITVDTSPLRSQRSRG